MNFGETSSEYMLDLDQIIAGMRIDDEGDLTPDVTTPVPLDPFQQPGFSEAHLWVSVLRKNLVNKPPISMNPRWASALPHNDQFKIKAVVDFVRIDLSLIEDVHPGQVLGFFGPGSVYENAVRLPGAVSNSFSVKMQDPGSFANIMKSLNALSDKYKLALPPVFSIVEVSMDFYSEEADFADLAELTAYLFKFCARKPSDYRRYATNGKKPVLINDFHDLLKSLLTEKVTAYIGRQKRLMGNSADPVSLRFYVKMTDQNAILSSREWRARMEITLQLGALPFRTLAEAERFRFEELAMWFKFRKYIDLRTVHPACHSLLRSKPSCERGKGQAGLPRRVKPRRSTCADNPLGNRTQSALRDLTRRWMA